MNTNENQESFKDGFASEINKGGHLWIPDLRMNEKAIKFQLEHEKYPESDKINKIIDSIVDDTLREVKIFRNYGVKFTVNEMVIT